MVSNGMRNQWKQQWLTKCVVALIYGAIRAERFCDGAILAFLKDGTFVRWLERLKTLDADGKNIAAK